MISIDNFQQIYNDNNQAKHKKFATNVLIITSIDDQDKLLSCLTPTNNETVVLNLNNETSIDSQSINNKRSFHQLENETLHNQNKSVNKKQRRDDLICVICEGSASGYNFKQITCESCKAFFRRNALLPIEKTKCLKSSHNNCIDIRCSIRYDIKNKCQRCRLIKCFQTGMRKDHILTTQEKFLKQKRLDENRLIRLLQINNNLQQIQNDIPTPSQSIDNIASSEWCSLSAVDWSCLNSIENAYFSALQSSPSASSVMSLELAPDRMSAYMNTFDIQNFAAVKLINFLRQIEEFDQLDEHDRLILVKYNLVFLFAIRLTLTFDPTRELIYDDILNASVSPADEAFAQYCKSLFMLCYGYEFNRTFMLILRQLTDIVNRDPIIIHLLILTIIFLKGLSVNDDQQAILKNNQQVFNIHSKYTDLLFRYLIQKSSFDVAVIQMMNITQLLIKIQRLMRDFHQYIKTKIDPNYVNPLMKSLLHLT